MNLREPDPSISRRRHWEMLVISCCVLLLAPLLKVYPNERVGSRWASQLLLPPTCASREFFGVSCPGCGLTRSFVHLAHGDWSASLQCHRVGWILMLFTILQLPYRVYALSGAGRRLPPRLLMQAIGYVLVALLIGNWIYNQLL